MHPSVPLILRVSKVHGFGLASYWNVCEAFGCLERALHKGVEDLAKVLPARVSAKVIEQAATSRDIQVEETLEWCSNNDVAIISHLDQRYPSRLREITRGPPLLYVKGSVEALNVPQLAIVGSRSSSRNGKNNAFSIAKELASSGLAITSGLALGIDTQAHNGALAGEGVTLAVVGNGIDSVYPRRNQKLAEQIIAENGVIVSEFPLKVAPSPENFPRRNRIISGLSVGTLVIEAALKSGSLITARYAIEQNREVFAMPGSVHNPLSRGCHHLIKQGAVLVEDSEDIFRELEGFVASRPVSEANDSPLAFDLSQDEKRLLSYLEHDPCDIEALAHHSGLAVEKLLANLMSLELMGLVSGEGGQYSLVANSATAQDEAID